MLRLPSNLGQALASWVRDDTKSVTLPRAPSLSSVDLELRTHERRVRFGRLSFIILIVLPTIVATIFYTLIAAPRYVSEARFIVRSVSSVHLTGLDMFLRTFGFAKSVDDSFVIQRYLQSRDVITTLQRDGVDLRAIFNRPEADTLSRFPRFWRGDTDESLYDFFRDRVDVSEDTVKGVLILKVVTFRPDDSLLIATKLLGLAEAMVNRMNDRAQSDTMRGVLAEVDAAQQKVMEAQHNITAFRNRESLIDPSQTSLSVIETVGTLSTDLAYASAQFLEMQASSPANPAIPGLKAKISSLEERIRLERAKMVGGNDALTDKIGEYDQLALKRDLADRSLASALGALESARQEAMRQHIYLEPVASASLADESTEPRRLRNILTVFCVGFALYAISWILSVGIGEHSQ